MTRERQDLTLVRGDDCIIYGQLFDYLGAPLPITGCTLKWVLKGHRLTGLTAKISKSTGLGITITDGPNGRFSITLAGSETATLKADVYWHEMMLKDGSNFVTTSYNGYLNLEPRAAPAT